MLGMSVQTRYDGTYDLGGLKPGTYRIGFRDWQSGHLDEYWDDAATVESAKDVVLAESEVVTGKDAQLASGSHITGKVSGPDGSGLGGVTVRTYQRSAGGDYWSPVWSGAQTRPDGTYDLGGLRPGTYRLEFRADQGGYVPEFWDDAASVESATDIIVGSSATVAGKDAQLATGSRITGKVTGPDGATVADVNVTAYQKDAGTDGEWSWTASTYTRPDGTYDLGGLAAGTYRIRFSPYQGGYADEYWNNAGSIDTAQDVVVGKSETVTGRDAQLASAAHIAGTVTGPDRVRLLRTRTSRRTRGRKRHSNG